LDIHDLSRRDFARALGTGLGAAVLHSSGLGARLGEASGAPEAPKTPVLLNYNENPYGPSPAALEAMTRAQSTAARYPDATADALVEAIARSHGLDSKHVVLGCGSGEILRAADAAFTGPGRRIVTAEPSFEAVLMMAKVTGADSVKVPLTADARHDLPRMAAACEGGGLAYVCNPNNPTGTIVSKDELERFLVAVPASTIVLVDEAYHHFVEDPGYASVIHWISRFPNLVVARTFSKVHGLAGMRLGYAVGTPELVTRLTDYLTFSNANAAVIAAAMASLADDKHTRSVRDRINGTRRWLSAEFAKDGRRYIPSHANFVMVDVGRDAKPVIEAFERRGILVGRQFPSMGQWLRVTIGTDEETRAFLVALREIVPVRTAAA
jgi:histidinol-phosphate aminotransferase